MMRRTEGGGRGLAAAGRGSPSWLLLLVLVSLLGQCWGLVILPGFGNAQEDYDSFVESLGKRGLKGRVLPLERREWLKCLGGVSSLDFWKSTAEPKVAYGWYLAKIRELVREEYAETQKKSILVAHSAGGWLARAALADGTEIWGENEETASDMIQGLITLGSPHFTPLDMDMTRGALTYTQREYPGAFLSSKGVKYVTVAGNICKGDRDAPRGDRSRFAFNSYRTVCGDGDGYGDGCVPLGSAHLEGAQQITIPCWHSIDKPKQWYGSEEIVDKWLKPSLAYFNPYQSRVSSPFSIPPSLFSFWRN